MDAIPADAPLTAIIHTAGVLDDAVLTELSTDSLDAVLAAKADAAWYLDQLSAEHDLDAFVLFSSAAGTLGAPGQANYAAANAFLDALAQQRHRQHRAASSLAWGYWQTPTGMSAHLGRVDQARLSRTSVTPITTEHGLALFDAALPQQRPALMLAPLPARMLARQARDNTLPPILSALTSSRPQASTASAEGLRAGLAGQSAEQQLATLTNLVRTSTATVLAHPDPGALDTEQAFKDLGIDSLTALELRNALTRSTGLTLPPTVIFDQPTPAALARHLTGLLTDTIAPAAANTDYFQQIQELITSIPANRLAQASILDVLQKLLLEDSDSSADQQNKASLTHMSLDDLVAVALDKSTKRMS